MFLLGLFIGGIIGVVIMSLCKIASWSDREMEYYEDRQNDDIMN